MKSKKWASVACGHCFKHFLCNYILRESLKDSTNNFCTQCHPVLPVVCILPIPHSLSVLCVCRTNWESIGDFLPFTPEGFTVYILRAQVVNLFSLKRCSRDTVLFSLLWGCTVCVHLPGVPKSAHLLCPCLQFRAQWRLPHSLLCFNVSMSLNASSPSLCALTLTHSRCADSYLSLCVWIFLVLGSGCMMLSRGITLGCMIFSPFLPLCEPKQQSVEGCLGVWAFMQDFLFIHTPLLEFICIYRVAHRESDATLWVSHSLFHKPFTDGHGGYPWFSIITA